MGIDRVRAARLSLLEGQALIDLGRSEEAVHRLNVTLSLSPRLGAARYEKGVAEFELCRFDDAKRTFRQVLEQMPDHAHALFHLGLIAEREEDGTSAGKFFAEASVHDPSSFAAPPQVSAADFAARVKKAVAALPADVRADIAQSHLETSELPAMRDLVAERPPLSPTILGLFRGLPLNWSTDDDGRPQTGRIAQGKTQRMSGRASASTAAAEADPGDTNCATPERTIVLYRRNLLRSVHDIAELDEAIRRTLLHEVGHLRGEDDGSLRDRGLE
jgi:predicted Zn-dependent protease with MMP-like domain